MADTKYPQYIQIAQERQEENNQLLRRRKTPQDVRQDKRGFPSARSAAMQPARDAKGSRAKAIESFSAQSQSIPNQSERLVQLVLWVRPIVKEWTVRRAKEEDLSISRFGSSLYEQATQNRIDLQYSSQLKPVIEKILRQEIRRAVELLIDTARDAQTTKQLASYVLERLPGVSREIHGNYLKLAAARTNEEMTNRFKKLSEYPPRAETKQLSQDNTLSEEESIQ
jgi:hypothetical protein